MKIFILFIWYKICGSVDLNRTFRFVDYPHQYHQSEKVFQTLEYPCQTQSIFFDFRFHFNRKNYKRTISNSINIFIYWKYIRNDWILEFNFRQCEMLFATFIKLLDFVGLLLTRLNGVLLNEKKDTSNLNQLVVVWKIIKCLILHMFTVHSSHTNWIFLL